MEGYPRKDEGCHQFLDLIPKEKKRAVKRAEETSSEDKKLELRLGPPGEQWTINENNNSSSKNTTFGYFSNSPRAQNSILKTPWQDQAKAHFLHLQNSENKASANTAVPNSSSAQKRTAPAPVVGWPPIRSFRKNLASGSSSKQDPDSSNVVLDKVSCQKSKETCPKETLFVKINMDGVPIGRKVDLKAYDSYEKLSYAVDELFRGLLAAQSDSSAGRSKDKEDGQKAIGGLLDRNGEYTLVYEDNEGDRMLVGDVPWHMFVSTVKRLRVLKSSELPTLSRGNKQGKLSHDTSLRC
ncbi:hypothetical protein CDL12_19369 [Handroanthus impetiginosus]|uniref:Auxin-responsive protein n=1 Tax=Handroanthus impetiginosus TaxID=429701 RepID=A0A2G9GS00_9LAMI|nr:hypothetical protein CDL12_19369 [Handroanthus impetiginosus]